MFNKIEAVPDLPKLEKEVIDYWKEIDVVEELKKARKGKETKIYYDGPITANNMPHYGHAIQWTLKDLIPRYWSMKDYYVSRNMGWDCQGIPVEYEVEKELGFEKKEDIEEYGVAKFNQLCRESVFKYRDAIFNYETRLGRWFDENDMYYTMDKDFIESMWWSLSELYKKGLLYEGHKVVAYSTRAGTTLSTHEVNAGGYEEVEDPYVTVKFKLVNDIKDKPTYVLAWTTTPWTIPGNLLLAINKKLDYALVEYDEVHYVVAKDLVDTLFKEKEIKKIHSIKTAELLDAEYTPPFDYFEHKRSEGVFKIIHSAHATTEEGTGIVHLAPYGAEDFEIFMEMGIVSLFDYLDETAHFTDQIPDYKGQFYKDADNIIIEDLDKKGNLFDSGRYVHRMPMCWRTDTPLIYKPIKSWYVAITKIKDRMLEENKTVRWVPEHVGTGIAGNWIENARDWALSRNRYWGTPLPLWVNDKTGEQKFIGSFEELQKLSGQTLEDPHRPFVDEITWEDKENGGTFKRVSDVIDVWYDSGAMPFAQVHYPFSGEKALKEKFPAEYICEATEQARLWFYTMHVLGVALFDQVPYKNVIAHGIMLAEDGKKLSKSKRNFPPMDDVLDSIGGDTLRLFILTSPIVQAESARFSEKALIEMRKEFFIPLWNSAKYFITYANLHNFNPTEKKPESNDVLDQWILAKLQEMINTVSENLDNYKVLPAARTFVPFVSELSTWYIRRSRDRIRVGDMEALETLYYVLTQFTKLIAPFTPFIAENLYKSLNLNELTGLKSVHIDLYPDTRKLTKTESEIIQKMEATRAVVNSALALRADEGIKIRQPLASVATNTKEIFEDLVKEEVNVKQVMYDLKSDSTEVNCKLDTKLTPELQAEGTAREIIRKLQDLRKKEKLQVSDTVEALYEDTPENNAAISAHKQEIMEKINAQSLKPSENYDVKKI